MSELMVLLQALLLIAGWLLFLRAPDRVARPSRAPVADGRAGRVAPDHRRPAAETGGRRRARRSATRGAPRELERYAARELETEPTPTSNETRTPPTPSARPETLTPDSGYNLSGSATSPSWRSADAGGARAKRRGNRAPNRLRARRSGAYPEPETTSDGGERMKLSSVFGIGLRRC
jgi:hypothetical protein